jgi:hypothetical protein
MAEEVPLGAESLDTFEVVVGVEGVEERQHGRYLGRRAAASDERVYMGGAMGEALGFACGPRAGDRRSSASAWLASR